ncbi:MAG: hypothetical protein B1H03_06595 [Planctomycetales bacterium 4484_113]|nr:MAG: hypothetical protein B1H03_06595 [Planctomycetales bacterium 4484_113]
MPLAQWIQGLGYFGVFLAMFIENLGIPFPVIFGLIGGAAMVTAHQGSIPAVLVVLVAGQVAGAATGYLLGAGGSRWVQRKLDASRRWRDSYWRIRHLYERWGWLTIIGCRMVGYVRPWSSITAGLMRMRFLPFLAATVIGASVWTLINWMIVYHGIHLFARAQWFRWVVLGLLIVALGGIAAFWWCWGRSRPSRKSNVSKHQEPNPAEND